jgi:hypothetical protein
MNHHLLIGGTGRAGTSFLVQYLTACGLETHMTLCPDDTLDPAANAGLEDFPLSKERLPYVVKSPWLFQCTDALLAREDIAIDAVILPMRDIVEGASSRAILEMRKRYHDGFPDEICQWETWGLTPGGVVFSLNPIDQARILALGFHQTVFALVQKEIPIIFLDFVRMIEDAQYLWRNIEPVLGAKFDRDTAIAAHAKVADSGKVRVSREMLAPDGPPASYESGATPIPRTIKHAELESLDRSALLRVMHEDHAAASESIARHRAIIASLETRLRETQALLRTTQFELQASHLTHNGAPGPKPVRKHKH